MKLDIFTNQWLDIVFEGRNKAYGAYELRKTNTKTTVKALVLGAIVFALAVSAPLIMSLIPNSSDESETLDTKITTVKLPPKKEEVKKDLPPPPPPPPKVDQVKFVKPVVAKAEEVTEEPPKIVEIKDKKLGAETIKGDPDAELTVEPVGSGPSAVVEEDTQIYNTAGIEVKPDFPGGMEKFYKFVGSNYQTPEEEGLKGKVYVTFVVEKDGSLTDIKVIRDIGYGTGKEAIRVLKKCPKWTPGEQNGKKVRVLYSLPITIQSAE
ncbi:energy transducer TonB [Flavobacterium gawalongense]|uniref:Energy transducer TonB n=1 Tax=Flavobacterium gawalongense TaxID=2594432 RepID=A0A553BUJ0_9FLAO|nr:energy transducer TonB [Flavobacterium gawalongense]TRX02370.1 energy transducer TonB [Flavobacterium gawalongense]TRX06436.1 energy transducer TonB [Flavobacterium gawalongense]TRX07801.1 energy transducer TonB [Flavobacterium gawalongense]TRX11927.1 energy transducer TonB [Flavobacterium gawalongense]TRX30924.1 energy transducer TonB [Flavobacterium gawalongense]